MLADPDKKVTLDQAITPVGTCTEMCPEFERLERMKQMMVDGAEKVREVSYAYKKTMLKSLAIRYSTVNGTGICLWKSEW